MEVYSIKFDKIFEPKPISFPNIIEIYQKSIVDWDDLYQSITVMVCKTSDNTEVINRLPFNLFSIKIQYLNKYIEAENKQANGGDGENDPNEVFQNTQQQAKSMMRNSNTFKPGNTKLPKISK